MPSRNYRSRFCIAAVAIVSFERSLFVRPSRKSYDFLGRNESWFAAHVYKDVYSSIYDLGIRRQMKYYALQNRRPGSRAWPFCEIFNMWLWHGPIRGRDHATHILQTNENSWKNASNNNSKFLKKKSHPIPWAVPQFAFFKSDQSTSLNILIFPSVAEHEKILKLLSILPK